MSRSADDHHRELMDELYVMYTNNILTDVVLIAGDVHVSCHRNVLAASSPYFRAMFTSAVRERDEKEVQLHNISPEILKAIIDYMYKGIIEITNENAQDIFITATIFEMLSLIGRCADHMIQEICSTNCIEIYMFASQFVCLKLKQYARVFILEHFSELLQENDIFDLELHDFEEIISSDDLSVDKEEIVFEAVMQWIAQGDRRRHFSRLFKHIRLTLLDDQFVEKHLPGNPLVTDDSYCRSVLMMRNLYKIKTENGMKLEDADGEFQASEIKIKTENGMKLEDADGEFDASEIKIKTENGMKLEDADGEFDASEMEDLGLITRPRLGMYNRTMLVFSGGAYGREERSFTAFDPVSLKSFMALKPHPTFDFKFKIDYYQLVTSSDKDVYFIGGIFYDEHHFEDHGQSLREIYRYNAREIRWEKKPDMTTQRCCFSVAVHDHCIFAIGGKPVYPRGEPTDSVEYYSTEHEAWFPAAALPIKLYSHASSATRDAIYVFGGKDEDDDYLDTVFRYDLSHDSWTLVTTQMMKPRAQLSSFFYKSKIYLIGGVSLHENILTVSIYDPEHNKWSLGGEFPDERKFVAASINDGTIFVCGGVRHLGVTGRRSRQVESRDLYKYEIDRDKWSKAAKLVQYGNTQSSAVAVLNTKYLQESEFVSAVS